MSVNEIKAVLLCQLLQHDKVLNCEQTFNQHRCWSVITYDDELSGLIQADDLCEH